MKSLRARLRPRRLEDRADQGFTLVELVVAIGLIGVVFAAVAAIMTSSLRALSVQKARSQGNEVATQAIEDLQRRDFDGLVLCTQASGTPPPGLDKWVEGPGCPNPVPATYGEDPCNGTNPVDAPKAEYTCTRSNIPFLVKRYIAWVDELQTSKRLAVFVTWRDAAGVHEVSQQSSLRAPGVQSVIGLARPTLHTGTANSTVNLNADGSLAGTLTFNVKSTDLDGADKVYANFWNVDDEGSLVLESVELTYGGAGSNSWSKTVSSGLRFPEGTQAVTFTAHREKDSKPAATVSHPASTFCKPTTVPCVRTALLQAPTASTYSVSLNAMGGNTSDFTITVLSDNVPSNGQVQVLLPTLAGVVALPMQPSTSCGSSTTSQCSWTATVSAAAGHAFAKGPQLVHVIAAQPYVAGSDVLRGMTDSASVEVSFG